LAAGVGNPLLPTAPQGVAAFPGPDPGIITVVWSPPASDGGTPIGSYKVYRGADASSLALHADVGTALTFVDSGLPAGSTFFYAVSATNLVGEGPLSDVVSATTFGVPSAPRNLAAAPGANPGEVALAWEAPESDGGSPLMAYRVWRAGGGAALAVVAEVPAGTTSHVDTGLAPLTVYHYLVTAVNAVGEGAASNDACAQAFPWVVLDPGLACVGPL
jgi:cellulose 1,4-beta-cellobiosidase